MKDINQIIAEVFQIKENEITDELKMENIDGWDSLTHMELIATLEDEYGIEFSSDEIMEMISIKKIKEILEVKQNEL